MEEFVIARKVKDTRPRTDKIYCRPADAWPSPDEVDIVERVAVRSCVRRSRIRPHHRPQTRDGVLAVGSVVVDSRGRDAWKFAGQQATTTKRTIPVGEMRAAELVPAVSDRGRIPAEVMRAYSSAHATS